MISSNMQKVRVTVPILLQTAWAVFPFTKPNVQTRNNFNLPGSIRQNKHTKYTSELLQNTLL